MELHIITGCVVVMAFGPACSRAWRSFNNWRHRQKIHRDHVAVQLAKLESQQ
jgi:hypothetical protein